MTKGDDPLPALPPAKVFILAHRYSVRQHIKLGDARHDIEAMVIQPGNWLHLSSSVLPKRELGVIPNSAMSGSCTAYNAICSAQHQGNTTVGGMC